MRINKTIIQIAQFMAGEYCTGRMLLQLPHELLRSKKERNKSQKNNKTTREKKKKIKPLN